MQIKPCKIYEKDLFLLWKEAFSDEDAYIKLFFETVYKKDVTVFAELDNDRIVSALYLMPSFIKNKDTLLNGFYLYAAATAKKYRGKGIMARLITEAQNFAAAEGKVFISLVPGEDYLYSYYEKFGFFPVMYRGKITVECRAESVLNDSIISLKDYFAYRDSMLTSNAHLLCNDAYIYAASCYEYLGLKAIKADSFMLLLDSGSNCIKELLLNDESNLTVFDEIKKVLPKGKYTAYTPFGEAEPFGMVWFAKEKICDKIYMNIALD